jgi:hypothetical protein
MTLGANEPPIFDAARLGTAAETAKILKTEPAMRDARNQLGSTPLHLAATNGDAGPLKALIAAGAEVNARDKEDNTPLHMAAYAGKSEAARLLLEGGADVNAKSTGGRTPLSLARKTRADGRMKTRCAGSARRKPTEAVEYSWEKTETATSRSKACPAAAHPAAQRAQSAPQRGPAEVSLENKTAHVNSRQAASHRDLRRVIIDAGF